MLFYQPCRKHSQGKTRDRSDAIRNLAGTYEGEQQGPTKPATPSSAVGHFALKAGGTKLSDGAKAICKRDCLHTQVHEPNLSCSFDRHRNTVLTNILTQEHKLPAPLPRRHFLVSATIGNRIKQQATFAIIKHRAHNHQHILQSYLTQQPNSQVPSRQTQ